jgi:hypothetical protein
MVFALLAVKTIQADAKCGVLKLIILQNRSADSKEVGKRSNS